MTQDDCKLITEKLLGEEWNEIAGKYYKMSNRTFQDPQDFFACFEKLVERGEWGNFITYADHYYGHTEEGVEWIDTYRDDSCPPSFAEVFTEYLNSRTESGHFRLCYLVAEWLTAQTIKENK
jgi:hypothetical protein